MKKSTILVLVGLALLLSLGVNGYQYYQKKQADKSAYSRASFNNFKDSIDNVIEEMELSLEHLALLQEDNKQMAKTVAELEARGPRTIVKTNSVNPNTETASLLAQIRSLQKQLKEASKPVNSILSGKGNQPLSTGDLEEINKYKNLVNTKQKEIESLKTKVKELEESREKYAQEKAHEAQAKFEGLKAENGDLKERLSQGAIPQFGNFTVTGGEMVDGIFKTSTKSKKIKRLRFSFMVLENPLIMEPIQEEVVLRVVNETGMVLSTKELNGSMMDPKDVYTIKDQIQVQANQQGGAPHVLWFPENGSLQDKLDKGKYTVELLSREKVRQLVDFEVD